MFARLFLYILFFHLYNNYINPLIDDFYYAKHMTLFPLGMFSFQKYLEKLHYPWHNALAKPYHALLNNVVPLLSREDFQNVYSSSQAILLFCSLNKYSIKHLYHYILN